MTGIERLVDIVTDGPYSGGMIHISVQKLREICEQIAREQDAAVKDSPCDAILTEDREAISWVRAYGGLEKVKQDALCWNTAESIAQTTLDWLARVCPVAGIEKCGYVVSLEKLEDAINRRLIPEGMEWPRYDTGELVGFGDEYVNAKGNVSTLRTIVIKDCRDRLGGGYYWKLGKGDCAVMVKNGERIKRPPVLAADGEPLEVGQTVYAPRYDYVRCTVLSFEWVVDGWLVEVENEGGNKFRQTPDCFTHQRPVLDANGVPIKVGDTVYGTVEGGPFIVTEVSDKGSVFVDAFPDTGMHGSMLTHTKPEPPDTWERIEKDKDLNPFDYCKKVGHKLWTFENAEEFKARDLVRRAKKLAGVDND